MQNQIISKETFVAFALAGSATFTITSVASGQHYTYRISASRDGNVHFVSALVNGDHYTYIGIIGSDGKFRRTAKSKLSTESRRFQTFCWFWNLANGTGSFPEALVVQHDGRCGRCGRQLTNPESINTGLGPVCSGRNVTAVLVEASNSSRTTGHPEKTADIFNARMERKLATDVERNVRQMREFAASLER